MAKNYLYKNANLIMRSDERHRLIIKLLAMLSQSGEGIDIIRKIIILIKETSGFDVVGIRLREDDDNSYYEINGLHEGFVKAEDNLCVFDDADDLICNPEGMLILECMCEKVMKGETDSFMNCFTEGGSFWTNSTTEFALQANVYYDLNTDIKNNCKRNHCSTKGCESIALIPLRAKNEIMGLLQLCDSQKDIFTDDLVSFFEGVGIGIGIALKHRLVVENLFESESRFRDLYDNAPNAYFSVSSDGIIIRCNRLTEELLGYRKEELIGKPIIELYADTSHGRDKASKIFRQFQAGEMITDEEMQMQKADGTPIWISLTVNSVKDVAGEVVESRSMVIDITERKKTEEELLRSEERYALAQSAANIGSWDWDIIKGDLQWSDTIEPMFGFGRGEFGATYEAFLDCVHSDDRGSVIDLINSSIEKNEDYSVEHRIVWPDGTIRWVLENGDVIRDNHGKPIRMLGIVQDITKRKEDEEELKKYREQLENMVEERTLDLKKANEKLIREIAERIKSDVERIKAYTELDQIFSTVTIGISYIDRDCNFIRFNKRFLDMFQMDEKECMEKKCYEIWDESICQTTNCPMRKILAGEKYVEYEVNKRLPDGKEIRCHVNSIPYISQEGDIIGTIQYYIDITEKREIQNEVLDISERERQRIGSDLHDLIGQNLTATAFLTEALRHKISNKQYTEAAENVDQIDSLIREAISQTRKITKMLNPVVMEKRGLKAAIISMAETTEDIYKIPCRVIQKGDFIIDDIHEATHLFYITREAINNAVKHGKPKSINIHL